MRFFTKKIYDGTHIFMFEISDTDFIVHTESESEKIFRKLSLRTDLISDKLMYLSELAKSIEEKEKM